MAAGKTASGIRSSAPERRGWVDSGRSRARIPGKGERTCLLPDHLDLTISTARSAAAPASTKSSLPLRYQRPVCRGCAPAPAARAPAELATLLDHGEPAARQFDRPAVDTFDSLTGPYVCVVQSQLVRELAGDTGQFAATQDAQHVGAVDGLVLLGSSKLLLDQPLPAAREGIAYFPTEAAVAGAARVRPRPAPGRARWHRPRQAAARSV